MAPSPGAAIPNKTLLVHIYYENEENLSRFSEELDLLEHADHGAGYVDALVEPDVHDALVAEGFRVDIDDEQTNLLNMMPYMSISGYSCYRTVEETYASMATLNTDYPGLVSIVDIGDTYEKVTAGGNPGYDLQAALSRSPKIA